MKYKLTIQMDISVIDEKYTNLKKHRKKKSIGDPIVITGTEEEIIDQLNFRVFNLIDLAADIYENGEENVILNAEKVNE